MKTAWSVVFKTQAAEGMSMRDYCVIAETAPEAINKAFDSLGESKEKVVRQITHIRCELSSLTVIS